MNDKIISERNLSREITRTNSFLRPIECISLYVIGMKLILNYTECNSLNQKMVKFGKIPMIYDLKVQHRKKVGVGV